jgi:hypothetical protein
MPLVATLGLKLGILGQKTQALEVDETIRMPIAIGHPPRPLQCKHRNQLHCWKTSFWPQYLRCRRGGRRWKPPGFWWLFGQNSSVARIKSIPADLWALLHRNWEFTSPPPSDVGHDDEIGEDRAGGASGKIRSCCCVLVKRRELRGLRDLLAFDDRYQMAVGRVRLVGSSRCWEPFSSVWDGKLSGVAEWTTDSASSISQGMTWAQSLLSKFWTARTVSRGYRIGFDAQH